jgi:hypothetical protein
MYVTDRLAELQVQPQYEAGDEITVKGGCGQILVAFKDMDRLKRIDLNLTLETVDPELTELITGSSLITQSGQSMGYSFPAVGAAAITGVCLEAWSKGWIGGGPPPGTTVNDGATTNASTTVTSATANFTSADIGRTISGTGIPGGATITSVTNATTVVISAAATATGSSVTLTIGRPGPWFRWVFPRWVAKFDNRTINNGISPTVLTGPAMENAMIGNGPVNDFPTGMLATSGRVGSVFRDAALPSILCGYTATPTQV